MFRWIGAPWYIKYFPCILKYQSWGLNLSQKLPIHNLNIDFLLYFKLSLWLNNNNLKKIRLAPGDESVVFFLLKFLLPSPQENHRNPSLKKRKLMIPIVEVYFIDYIVTIHKQSPIYTVNENSRPLQRAKATQNLR